MTVSKFTPEARSCLLGALAGGLSLAEAARSLGLSEKTLEGWLARGRREDSGAHAEFSASVARVREAASVRLAPMSEDELIAVVSAEARGGSVRAMELRWKMLAAPHGEEATPDVVDDPLAEADELARRRQTR
jgi:transposase